MTTIATDGRTMAGDGLCVGGGMIHGYSTRKVQRLRDGRIVGVSGSLYDAQAIITWLETGGEKPSLDDVEALVLHPDGACFTYNAKCIGAPQELPAVTGSGGALALGAMLAGASPEEAVAIAARRDTSTGGAIIVETLK